MSCRPLLPHLSTICLVCLQSMWSNPPGCGFAQHVVHVVFIVIIVVAVMAFSYILQGSSRETYCGHFQVCHIWIVYLILQEAKAQEATVK